MANLNEAIIHKDLIKSLNEAVTEKPQENKRPEGAKEWTFADWFGRDLTGQIYDGDIYCSGYGLTSLKGAPEKVRGSFMCYYNQLTSLKGAPKEVGENFYCHINQLTSLEGAPEKVGESFYCDSNHLTSLEGAPKEVRGDFHCPGNQLTSLKGAPKEVKGNFECFDNKLASLKGASEKVGGDFVCSYNQLTSLKGAPKEVGGNFICDHNHLTSLEGVPKEIGGRMLCGGNPLKSSKDKKAKNSKTAYDKIVSWKFEENPDGITSPDGWDYQHDIAGFVCFSDVIIDDDSLLDEFRDFAEENGLEVEPRAFCGVNSSEWTIGIDFEVEVTAECNEDDGDENEDGEECYYDIIPDKKDAKEAAERLIKEYNEGTLQKWMKEHGIEIGKNPSVRMFLVGLEYA